MDCTRLREDLRLPAEVEAQEPRFVVSGEISTIYKRGGRTRKVHHVLLLPGLDEAEALSQKLEAIGNLRSDGRPILGLDSHDLLEIVLETCPEAVYIPAHVWTPHFSLFGAFSGFDAVEECFGDLTPYVHALETGLSSDPPMNRRCSMLDRFQLVSNSDAHSPNKLGREGEPPVLRAELFRAQQRAIETGEGLEGTVEFFSGGGEVPTSTATAPAATAWSRPRDRAGQPLPGLWQARDHRRGAPRGGAGRPAGGRGAGGQPAL